MILIYIISFFYIIKFIKYYLPKFVCKDFCNFILIKACKLKDYEFYFFINLTYIIIFIKSSVYKSRLYSNSKSIYSHYSQFNYIL